MNNYPKENSVVSRLHANSSLQNSAQTELLNQQTIAGDDQYPGTFFRIPGVPRPGKTTWSLTK
jgi:hypothetical protein